MARELRAALGLTVSMIASLVLASPAQADEYDLGKGPKDGIKVAAESVLDANPSCGLTVNKLAAMMIAVPMWELLGGSQTLSPSPMTLSRYDTAALRSANLPLYSDSTTAGPYKRAHWNPGIGLWQLDTYGPTIALNTWQRIKTNGNAGETIAEHFRSYTCAGNIAGAFSIWYACSNSKCFNAYQAIYNSSNDTLNLDVNQSLTEWDGGAVTTTCRFGSSGSTFNCGFISDQRIEGYAYTSSPQGNGASSPTPLAKPFFGFTAGSNKKFMVWLKNGTGWDDEVTRKIDSGDDARQGPGGLWPRGSTLQVFDCTNPDPLGPPSFWNPDGLDP